MGALKNLHVLRVEAVKLAQSTPAKDEVAKAGL